jgi:hypothetical protein
MLVQRHEPVVDAGQYAFGAVLGYLRLDPQFVLDPYGLAPQHCHVEIGAHPGEQLARTERLGQIVVRPGRQSFDLGLFTGPCR